MECEDGFIQREAYNALIRYGSFRLPGWSRLLVKLVLVDVRNYKKSRNRALIRMLTRL